MVERYFQIESCSKLNPETLSLSLPIIRSQKEFDACLAFVDISSPGTKISFIYYEPRSPDDRTKQAVEAEPQDFFCACGKPASVVYLCETCGGFKFCDDCFDYSAIFNHCDHDCSTECCARHHKAEVITEEELERRIPKVVQEMKFLQRRKKHLVWLVYARKITAEEFEEAKIAYAQSENVIVAEWPKVVRIDSTSDGVIETIDGDLTKDYLYTLNGVIHRPPDQPSWSKVIVTKFT